MHTKPQGYWPFGSKEEDFLKGFYHIWVWQPSWSCDPDTANKLLFLLTIEVLYDPVVSEKKMFEEFSLYESM